MCNTGHLKGHLQRMCKRNRTHHVAEEMVDDPLFSEEQAEDDEVLGLYTCTNNSPSVIMEVKINGVPVSMEVDTGSDNCIPNPCQNGGTCESTQTGYKCYCSNINNGTDCEISETDNCTPNPCQNGGTCESTQTGYKCYCSNIHNGTDCEITETVNPCQTDGIRQPIPTGRKCHSSNLNNGNDYKILSNGTDCEDVNAGTEDYNFSDETDYQSYETRILIIVHNPGALFSLQLEEQVGMRVLLPVAHTNTSTVSFLFSVAVIELLTTCSDEHISDEELESEDEIIQHNASDEQDGQMPKIFFGTKTGAIENPCITESMLKVTLGKTNVRRREGITFGVEQIIIHGSYNKTDNAIYNDIALLKLKGSCAKENNHVKTINLAEDYFSPGTECKISGWGKTEYGQYRSQLLEGTVKLISRSHCMEPQVYGNLLGENMMCAGYLEGGSVDACQGDSGGPLSCVRNGVHYLYGVISWGYDCGKKNKPGVYVIVTKFLNWIRRYTQ
uniref:hyaluronan-binding protein 2-like n=1 Tax=Pristiophorus japonicus TaxID=55135 RepID=UPI00398EFE15